MGVTGNIVVFTGGKEAWEKRLIPCNSVVTLLKRSITNTSLYILWNNKKLHVWKITITLLLVTISNFFKGDICKKSIKIKKFELRFCNKTITERYNSLFFKVEGFFLLFLKTKIPKRGSLAIFPYQNDGLFQLSGRASKILLKMWKHSASTSKEKTVKKNNSVKIPDALMLEKIKMNTDTLSPFSNWHVKYYFLPKKCFSFKLNLI